MSCEEDKEKRSARRHRNYNAINRQLKIAKQHGMENQQPHRLVKHHAMDCGVPGCIMCGNPRKYGELSIQEQRFYQDAETQRSIRSNGVVYED